MMCQRIGRSPISTIGFGRTAVSSESRVPNPPARITVLSGIGGLPVEQVEDLGVQRGVELAGEELSGGLELGEVGRAQDRGCALPALQSM